MTTVRPMTIADYEPVFVLWQRTEGLCLTDADSREATSEYLSRNPGISHVAVEGERVIGAALCGHDGRRGLLHHLAVELEHRGRGLGRAIVEACHAALVQAGIGRCNIYVIDEHEAGKQFWRHLGFWEWPEIRLMSRDSNPAGNSCGT